MKAHHRALGDIPAEALDGLIAESFFASRGFVDLWRTMGGRPIAWTVEDGGRVVAVIPGVEYGLGPFTRFASMPDGCYGGLFCAPGRAGDHAIACTLLDAIAARRYAKCFLFDYPGRLPSHAAFEPEGCATRLVNIAGPGWMPEDRKLQAEIRMGARAGIRVARFDRERHMAGFLGLMELTARRHGARPRYRTRLFERLADLAERDPRVRWRFAEHDGRPVASHIYFVERGTLVSWQDFFDKSFTGLKPNQYIRWQVCQEVAAEGIEWLNLGSSPAHAAGVEAYKSRWGGEMYRFRSLTRWQGVGALIHARAKRDMRRRSRVRVAV